MQQQQQQQQQHHLLDVGIAVVLISLGITPGAKPTTASIQLTRNMSIEP
jgi:hypothetical protein